MKNLLMSGLFLLLGNIYLSAQNTVSGTVTDKKGNPIPGAKVVVKGGTETTLSELDGTFKLESNKPIKKIKIYYGGMRPKELNVAPLSVQLYKESWWTQKPEKYQWFASLQAGIPENDFGSPSFGLMVGGVKNLGWYVKGLYRPLQSTDYESNSETSNHWYTGKSKNSFYSATGGLILRLWCPIHIYFGAGYAKRKIAWEMTGDKYLRYDPDCYDGAALDFGLMFRIKNILVNAGSIYTIKNGDKGNEFVGNIGIGYCF